MTIFYDSVQNELKNIQFKIYFTSTIFSEGFKEENKTKPEITKKFEYSSFGKDCNPQDRALMLIKQMGYRNRISSDWITHLIMINTRCERFYDFLILPFACFFNQMIRIYIDFYFR